MIQLLPAANHDHCAQVNARGNGVTTQAAGHVHPIVDWRVQPVAGHTHPVATSPNGQVVACGAGAKPCNCGRK